MRSRVIAALSRLHRFIYMPDARVGYTASRDKGPDIAISPSVLLHHREPVRAHAAINLQKMQGAVTWELLIVSAAQLMERIPTDYQ